MKVAVYWNLNKDCWSIQSREGESYGRLLGYAQRVGLHGVEFKVRESGRQRVLKEKQKNVHAYAVGHLSAYVNAHGDIVLGSDYEKADHYLQWVEGGLDGTTAVTYSPYRAPTFVDNIGSPIKRAALVDLEDRSWVSALGAE